MVQIVGLGQASMEYLGVVPRLPSFGGGMEPLNAFVVSAGGSAATAVATAATLVLQQHLADSRPVGPLVDGHL